VTEALTLQKSLVVASRLSLPTDPGRGNLAHGGGSGSRSPPVSYHLYLLLVFNLYYVYFYLTFSL